MNKSEQNFFKTIKKFINNPELNEIIDKGKKFADELLTEWEEKLGVDKDEEETKSSSNSERFIDDLKIFGLTPSASWADVKKARNELIKKYHPDKFTKEREKIETAQEITQKVNAAFERLKNDF